MTVTLQTSVDKIALVMEMEQAGGEQNWDYFKTFFTDDVLFKVGSAQEKEDGKRSPII